MLSSESYATILGLKKIDPKHEQGPLLVFVGVRIPDHTAIQLYRYYGARPLLLSTTDLKTLNTDYASTFIFTKGSFEQEETFTELWRVAKEMAEVFILNGMKNGVVEPGTVANPHDYGFDVYYTGTNTTVWPFSKGIVRKDKAKHFRR
jgi:hypothetical protein